MVDLEAGHDVLDDVIELGVGWPHTLREVGAGDGSGAGTEAGAGAGAGGALVETGGEGRAGHSRARAKASKPSEPKPARRPCPERGGGTSVLRQRGECWGAAARGEATS